MTFKHRYRYLILYSKQIPDITNFQNFFLWEQYFCNIFNLRATTKIGDFQYRNQYLSTVLYAGVQAVVCSADSYFLRDGVYNFDPSLLKVCKGVRLSFWFERSLGVFFYKRGYVEVSVSFKRSFVSGSGFSCALAYGSELRIQKLQKYLQKGLISFINN
jgi:hypothetical protein